jgi:signal transduction histidine kinase
MNPKQLTAVVALMTVALIGLTGIQVYWVQTALRLKESQLQLSVQTALQNVVAHLEARESRASALQLVAQGNELQNNLATPGAQYKPAARMPLYATPAEKQPLLKPSGSAFRQTAVNTNTLTESEREAAVSTEQKPSESKPSQLPSSPIRIITGTASQAAPSEADKPDARKRRQVTAKNKDQAKPQVIVGFGGSMARNEGRIAERSLSSSEADARLRSPMGAPATGIFPPAEKRPPLPPPFFINTLRGYSFATKADSAMAQAAITEYQQNHRLMQERFKRQFPFWAKVLDDSMLTTTESPEGLSISMYGQPMLPQSVTITGEDGESWQYTDRMEFRVISPEDIIQRRKQEQEQKLQAEEALRYEKLQRELQLRALRAKMDALRETLLEILYKPKKLRERVEASLLDSLLGAELRANGIDQTYDWAVEQDNEVVLMPARMMTVGLQKQLYQYQVRLYPNDVQASPFRLTLSLPTERYYVLKQVAWVVAVAGLFILCIVFGFVYSVRTIIRQKKLSEMKTDFINNMTHEFKTPISTISLAAEAILEPRVQTNPQQMGRFTRIIQDENRRLQSQVERVLQMAEIDRGEMQLDLQEANANELLNEVVQKIRLQVEKRGGTLAYENTAHTVRLLADPLHLSNVFLNLMDNAIKYSPNAPAIEVHAWNYGGKYCVSIADQGIGMSADTQKRIFEKFYRVPTGNLHDVKGFGLGLSYVKSIVMGHNGHIEVKSELGKGSRFTVILPLMNVTGK